MKINAARVDDKLHAEEVAADIAILVQLSTVHARQGEAFVDDARRLASGLSSEATPIYVALSRAHKLPLVVTLEGDCCSGCNMRLPSALLAEIRRFARLHRCPSCKRVVSLRTAALEAK